MPGDEHGYMYSFVGAPAETIAAAYIFGLLGHFLVLFRKSTEHPEQDEQQ